MSTTRMSVLSKDDIEEVHAVSLRILSEVGVKIDSPSVLEMLGREGVRVDIERGIAFLDESMVSQALGDSPRKVRICSRGGTDFSVPEPGVHLISPDGQPPAVFDVSTGSKRPSRLDDVVDFAVLCDALPEVDYVWPPVVATDMPSKKSSWFEFLATMTHCAKHVQHGAASPEEAQFQIEVASAIAGSPEELRRRPLFSDVFTPISPLRYDQGEAEAIVVLSRAGIPLVHLSMGIAGSVTPVTIAGTLAIVNAENLCGLTITQAANRGAPVIYSSFSGVTDLRSGVFLCGTPEGVLMDACAVEMARHYGLPSCAGGPSNAARTLSAEAGYQTMMTAMGSMLAGADLMVGLGGLDRAGMMSKEKLVMDCEMWRWLERLGKGVDMSPDAIGFEAIKRQGPSGIFLSDPHTLKNMRKDMMIPQVTGYHASGEPDYTRDDLIEHAKKKTKEILATHRPPPLSQDMADKVGAVAERHGILLPGGRQIFGRA
ncbi:MAG: trimethylamine methyltransferase family protein [Candidatus Thermoplasmatota archaeon]|nr:trimethylamine methyltransferase family protein [Candidatus Thermoplasmatota archaeon]